MREYKHRFPLTKLKNGWWDRADKYGRFLNGIDQDNIRAVLESHDLPMKFKEVVSLFFTRFLADNKHLGKWTITFRYSDGVSKYSESNFVEFVHCNNQNDRMPKVKINPVRLTIDWVSDAGNGEDSSKWIKKSFFLMDFPRSYDLMTEAWDCFDNIKTPQ